MARNYFIWTFACLWSLAIILGITWGTTYNWPDFQHVNHGTPFVWATHTLNTIIGPVDKWSVDLYTLTLDLVFWLAIMIIGLIIATRFARTPTRR